MTGAPYQPPTWCDLALERPFPDLEMKMKDERCPACNLNWRLFPPAQISGLPMVRCVECKRVYDEDGSETNGD
jgi:hypothetical protein